MSGDFLDYAVSVYFQIWFYAAIRKFARQVRYDRGEKFAFYPRPYLIRNFLTPERKNFVVTPKIKLTKGLALMLWFRCVQIVFEELISITRATIYCDEFRLFKSCVNRDQKNALTSLPQTHAACFQKFLILRNFNEPRDHLMNINETQQTYIKAYHSNTIVIEVYCQHCII